jgi:ATP phosphoribosyltransferase regulatory subunit HisZ
MLSFSHRAEQQLISSHEKFGYTLQETPVVDDAELFQTRAGDKVIQELFTFERKGKLFALRPEFTTTAMRQYLQSGITEPVRWQFFGQTFADIATQGYQEQLGAGFELINVDGIHADIEAILVSLEGSKSLGLTNLNSTHLLLRLFYKIAR